MDRRQTKTRQAIYDAFVNLMAQTGYEKISVKDIIDAANIGRSTFYSHFETKDDLARKMCLMLFKHIFSHTIPPCSTHNFSELPQNAENRIAHILYHLRDKRKYYWGIINYDEGNLFLRFFREYIQDNLRIIIQGAHQQSTGGFFSRPYRQQLCRHGPLVAEKRHAPNAGGGSGLLYDLNKSCHCRV